MAKENTIVVNHTLTLVLFGHVDHGKTTLTVAISNRFGIAVISLVNQPKTMRLRCCSSQNANAVSLINTAHVIMKLKNVTYAHIDAPGHADHVKTWSLVLPKWTDILVVALTDGPMPQTREHILSRQVGVKHLIVSNKVDLVDDEECELLNGKSRPIVRIRLPGVRSSISKVCTCALEGDSNTKTLLWNWCCWWYIQNQNVTLTNHCFFQSRTYLNHWRSWSCSECIDRGIVKVNDEPKSLVIKEENS